MTEDRDWKKFEACAVDYLYALNYVREEMYGKGNGNWANLPGSCAEVVRTVTNEIWYQAFDDFGSKLIPYDPEALINNLEEPTSNE